MVLVVTLLLAGVLLLFAETILPGMIAGILGVACLIAGVSAGYTEFGATTGNWILLGTLMGLVIGFALWLKYFPDSRVAQLYTSKGAIGDIGAERPDLVGKQGLTHTVLRPSGVAIIGGERIDVVTEGALIERGVAVKVIAVEGARVVVREV